MNYNIQEEEIPQSFGYKHNAPHPVNTNKSLIDMKTIRQYKAEQARILEQFNTPYYSLLELGAQNMLSFEHFGRMVVDLFSGSFISEKIKSFKEFIIAAASEPTHQEDETITVNKVDIIQKQLDAIVAQMEKVKEESRRKTEELEMLKRSVAERKMLQNPEHEPFRQPPSIFNGKSSTDYDDYVMDFSKPAGYKPPASPVKTVLPPAASAPAPAPAARSLFAEDANVVVRRRSMEPKSDEVKPPVPSTPPPRKSGSREAKPAVPQPRENPMERQHNLLMEEIRKSASLRKARMEEEEKQGGRDLETIVKGTKDESQITKKQRQMKMSLNDEIRMKMQERLKVMRDSDTEEENGVNEMD